MLTQRLLRAVSRHGAPMRVLKSMVSADSTIYKMLPEHDAFMHAYRRQVTKEYKDLKSASTRALLKVLPLSLLPR